MLNNLVLLWGLMGRGAKFCLGVGGQAAWALPSGTLSAPNQRLGAAGLSEARVSGLEQHLLTWQPQAARVGARTRLALPPTSPVECLSTSCWRRASGHSSFCPELARAWVSATVSFRSTPHSRAAMSMVPRHGVQRGKQREGALPP